MAGNILLTEGIFTKCLYQLRYHYPASGIRHRRPSRAINSPRRLESLRPKLGDEFHRYYRGAIPFSGKPTRLIPINVIGSALGAGVARFGADALFLPLWTVRCRHQQNQWGI